MMKKEIMGEALSSSNTRLWTKNFALIMLSNFFIYISFQMAMPIIPLYSYSLGASQQLVGAIGAAATFSAVFMRPMAGRLIDRKSRKLIYIISLIGNILFVFAYGLAATIPLLIFFRLLHGLSWSTSTTSAVTIASDSVPLPRLAEGMGFYGMTSTVALAVSPMISLYLLNYLDYRNTFFIAGALAVLGLLMASGLKLKPIEKTTVQPGVREPLYEKSAFPPAVTMFFICLTYGALMTFITLYAVQENIKNIGPFFTVLALTLLLSRPNSGKLADRYGFHTLMIPSCILCALSMLILGFADRLSIFLVVAALYGVGLGAIIPSLQAMAVAYVPINRKGAANATLMTGFDLGMSFGSLGSGFIAQYAGYSTLYLICIIPIVLALVFSQIMRKPKSAVKN